jgi:hypothetical protein
MVSILSSNRFNVLSQQNCFIETNITQKQHQNLITKRTVKYTEFNQAQNCQGNFKMTQQERNRQLNSIRIRQYHKTQKYWKKDDNIKHEIIMEGERAMRSMNWRKPCMQTCTIPPPLTKKALDQLLVFLDTSVIPFA